MKHYNPSISENAARIFNAKQGDYLGDEVQGIFATVEIQPRANIVKTSYSTGAAATIYTTPSGKDFYLTSASFGFCKDAASLAASFLLRVYVDGVQVAILEHGSIASTAHQGSMAISFPIPIKIDRGTNITIQPDNNSATVRVDATITGYTVETTKGT